MSRLRQLIHEIHRRSLWQVLGIYVVGSVAVLGGAGTLADVLRLPDWFVPLAFGLLIVGLPIVLATAFVQEGGPGREIKERRNGVPASASGWLTWRNAFGGGVLAFALWGVVAAGWALFGGAIRDVSPEDLSGADRPVIAVLPFVNMSGDPEDVYFTNGMRDEILTSLSKVGGLRVIDPPSISEDQDLSGSLRQVAAGLSVKYVRASVRRATGLVRIAVQLVDADTDEQLWAENYTRELSPAAVFDIQSDVAQRIAEALSAELTPEEVVEVAARPTESREAYDLFLRANERPGFGEAGMRAAVLAYQRAVEIDPLFISAWTRLAAVHISIYFFRYDYSDERLALAREALERARALNPDELEVLETQALYHYQGELDYERAIEIYQQVERRDPARRGIASSIAFVQRRMGLLDQAAENLRRESELQPLDPRVAYQQGETAVLRGRYDEAERHFRRSVELDPLWLRPFGYLGMLPIQRYGDPDAGREAMAQSVAAGAWAEYDAFGPSAWVLIDRVSGEFLEGEERIRDEGWDVIDTQFYYWPADFLIGEYRRFDGDIERARRSYRLAEGHLLRELEERPEDERLHSTLGRVYAGLGEAASALERGLRGVDLMPLEREAYRGAFRLEELAAIHAALGNADDAVEVLTEVAEAPTYLSQQLLTSDPTWASIRDHPRFSQMVQLHN